MTLLADHLRRAAHSLHVCGWCQHNIDRGEQYVDQRIADNGTVYTWRAHRHCQSMVWRYLHSEGIHELDEGVDVRDVYADALEWWTSTGGGR